MLAGGLTLENPIVRRATSGLLAVSAIAMVSGAAWFGAYPLYTNLKAADAQDSLKLAFATPKLRTVYGARRLAEGSPLTRIVMPSISVDSLVVEGISTKALNTGAGHYPMTPLPGERGNVGIAGHRTMYGKPFSDIDKLKSGDRIQLITPLARHVYEVLPAFGGHPNPWIVKNNTWEVVERTTEPMLTLTACHPKGSSKQRIVVRAKLISTEKNA